MRDIKSGLFYNMDWTGAAWTDQHHYEIKNNNSLLSLRIMKINKKLLIFTVILNKFQTKELCVLVEKNQVI